MQAHLTVNFSVLDSSKIKQITPLGVNFLCSGALLRVTGKAAHDTVLQSAQMGELLFLHIFFNQLSDSSISVYAHVHSAADHALVTT